PDVEVLRPDGGRFPGGVHPRAPPAGDPLLPLATGRTAAGAALGGAVRGALAHLPPAGRPLRGARPPERVRPRPRPRPRGGGRGRRAARVTAPLPGGARGAGVGPGGGPRAPGAAAPATVPPQALFAPCGRAGAGPPPPSPPLDGTTSISAMQIHLGVEMPVDM